MVALFIVSQQTDSRNEVAHHTFGAVFSGTEGTVQSVANASGGEEVATLLAVELSKDVADVVLGRLEVYVELLGYLLVGVPA